jgi:signal transduction histidine kinase
LAKTKDILEKKISALPAMDAEVDRAQADKSTDKFANEQKRLEDVLHDLGHILQNWRSGWDLFLIHFEHKGDASVLDLDRKMIDGLTKMHEWIDANRDLQGEDLVLSYQKLIRLLDAVVGEVAEFVRKLELKYPGLAGNKDFQRFKKAQEYLQNELGSNIDGDYNFESVDKRRVDLNAVIRQYAGWMGSKDIRIIETFSADVGDVPLDALKFSHVVSNLIINAKAAMDGSGEVTIETKIDGADAVIVFTDNGPGIPENVLSRVFEPGFTTKAETGGTGLGLPLCKKIVEAHGGTITAENAKDVNGKVTGARFIIRLPADRAQTDNAITFDQAKAKIEVAVAKIKELNRQFEFGPLQPLVDAGKMDEFKARIREMHVESVVFQTRLNKLVAMSVHKVFLDIAKTVVMANESEQLSLLEGLTEHQVVLEQAFMAVFSLGLWIGDDMTTVFGQTFWLWGGGNKSEFLKQTKRLYRHARWIHDDLPMNVMDQDVLKDHGKRERAEIALRSIKHDLWNDLPHFMDGLLDLIDAMSTKEGWSLDDRGMFYGLSRRIKFLTTNRLSRQYEDDELSSFHAALRLAVDVVKRNFGERFDKNQKFRVMQDMLSFIDGDAVVEKMYLDIAKVIVSNAFEGVFSGAMVDDLKNKFPGSSIDLDIKGMSGIMYSVRERAFSDLFQTLLTNTRQIWSQRLRAGQADKTLRIIVRGQYVNDEELILEYEDTAGGFTDLSLLDKGKDVDDPERQEVFLLNRSGREGGTGLGLAQVYHIVRLHGGTITAENAKDANGKVTGARFIIRLPPNVDRAQVDPVQRERIRQKQEELLEYARGLAKRFPQYPWMRWEDAAVVPWSEIVREKDRWDVNGPEVDDIWFGSLENRWNYWANQIDVRRVFLDMIAVSLDSKIRPDILGFLKEARRCLITGKDGESIYSPGTAMFESMNLDAMIVMRDLSLPLLENMQDHLANLVVRRRDQGIVSIQDLFLLYEQLMWMRKPGVPWMNVPAPFTYGSMTFSYGNHSFVMNLINAFLRLEQGKGMANGRFDKNLFLTGNRDLGLQEFEQMMRDAGLRVNEEGAVEGGRRNRMQEQKDKAQFKEGDAEKNLFDRAQAAQEIILPEVVNAEIDGLGEKPEKLIKLKRAGLNVPKFFIIKSNGSGRLQINDALRKAFDGLKKPLIVRSAHRQEGKEHSYSGVFDSYGDISVLTEAKRLSQGGKEDDWSSVPESVEKAYDYMVEGARDGFRSKEYRDTLKITDFDANDMNAVIMEQVDVDVFGMFVTSDTHDQDKVLIHYEVRDQEGNSPGGVIVYDKRAHALEENKLDDHVRAILVQFGETAVKVEGLFGVQQIELASSREDGQVYVLQSRTINLGDPSDLPRMAQYKTLSDMSNSMKAIGYGSYRLPVLVVESARKAMQNDNSPESLALNERFVKAYTDRDTEEQTLIMRQIEKRYRDELVAFQKAHPEFILVIKDGVSVVDVNTKKDYTFLNGLAADAKVVIRGMDQVAIRHDNWKNVETGGVTIIADYDDHILDRFHYKLDSSVFASRRIKDDMCVFKGNIGRQFPAMISSGDYLNVLSNIDGVFVWYDDKLDQPLDKAEAVNPAQNGGIDLTRDKMNVEVKSSGEGLQFNFDPATIAQWQNASGVNPVIIDIHPMTTSLPAFLGIQEAVPAGQLTAR